MGVRTAVRNNRTLGPTRYGLARDINGNVYINEDEAYWIREIFGWCIGDWGLFRIVRRLNELGVPTRHKSKRGWSPSMVARILRSSYVYGELMYLLDGEQLKISVPEIVTKEIYDKANKARAGRKSFRSRPTNRTYLIRPGKIRCIQCNLTFRVKSRSACVKYRSGNGSVKTYGRRELKPLIICRGLENYPQLFNCRSPKHLDFENIQARIWALLAPLLAGDVAVRNLYPLDNYESDDRNRQLKQAQERVEGIKREISWVLTKGRQSHLPDDIVDLQLCHLTEKLAHTQDEVNKLLNELNKKHSREDIEAAEKSLRLLQPEMHLWHLDSLPLERKATLVDSLVDEVTIDQKGQISLHMSIPVLESFCRQLAKKA